MRAPVLLRRVEYALWIAGALTTGFCAGVLLETHIYQSLQNKRLEEELRARRPGTPTFPSPHARRPLGSLVGRIEIPRLGFKAIVLEGSDSSTLRVAVGHIPETAQPGERGNFVLGGHRDTFFRPLSGIRDGDQIEMVTTNGTYKYAVEWTQVIYPSETEVLKPTREPSLTLVTCYPFHFIGSAPQRFIVRARQIQTGPVTGVQAASLQQLTIPTRSSRPHPVAQPGVRLLSQPRGAKLAGNNRPDHRQLYGR
jgi:sortase A